MVRSSAGRGRRLVGALDTSAIKIIAMPTRRIRGRTPSVTGSRARSWWAMVSTLGLLSTTGCVDTAGVSSPTPPSASAAVADEPHTRFDVLFARDIIEHGAQAVALGELLVVKNDVEPDAADIARRIAANNTGRTRELQSFLLEWGFTPMTVSPDPPQSESGVKVQRGQHPLATDADYRVLRDSIEPGATGVFVDLMIRQNQFTISAARSQLQSGSHPGAMAVARSLIQEQQAEISALEALSR
ncbi:DUF305 domain-containing protein [Mycolicibacterium arenosum]|uniref:DUF305 domain-containing protein n=1 Tax=Mycolicibacterium arenosum TaxID=2952157 RepID=A0ABT1MBG4_9MYCO|nr:DUF305 domain-containing protein [Mycolicibacterium sp. CAU 1645]MCP9276521.1 DUF305 domain-containing protein [Mycolicibacterium sp. CAU 1645]